MDFILDMSEGTTIVGYHEGRAVALPLDLPKPIIHKCTKKMTNVRDSTGQIIHTEVMLSDNGRAYRVEDRVLKETIFGSVHCGYCLSALGDGDGYADCQSSLVAVKKYSKVIIKGNVSITQEDPLKEFAAMQFLGNDNPHLMGQLDCLEDNSYYYSIMTFCTGGELFSYIDTGAGRMSEPKARKTFAQILEGLSAMHAQGIAHRDMSLENILIFHPDDDDKMRIVIIDWGMCVRVPQYKGESGRVPFLVPSLGCCGKKNYIAPEVIRNANKATGVPFCPMRADIWALGVILFMLLTGIPPFETAVDTNRAYDAVKKGKLRALVQHWGHGGLSASVLDLLERLFTIAPQDRLTIEEIKEHPWMTQ